MNAVALFAGIRENLLPVNVGEPGVTNNRRRKKGVFSKSCYQHSPQKEAWQQYAVLFWCTALSRSAPWWNHKNGNQFVRSLRLAGAFRFISLDFIINNTQ
jgi:hypothetical protein